jgi:hypothetical protein
LLASRVLCYVCSCLQERVGVDSEPLAYAFGLLNKGTSD